MAETPGRPLLRAALVGLATLVGLAVLAAAGALLQIRSNVTGATDDLTRISQGLALPELVEKPTPADIKAFMATVPVPATLRGKSGQTVATTGPVSGLWDRAGVGWVGDLATVGSGAAVVDGAVDVTRALPLGRSLTLRTDVGRAATGVSGSSVLLAGLLALLGALGVAFATFMNARRRGRRVAAVVGLAEAIASGRPVTEEQLPTSGEFVRIGEALKTNAHKLAHLGEVADRELSVLASAIEPLPVGVAGRGPTGGRLRNVALERLIEEMTPDDRAPVETAIQEGLDGTGPVGSRVTLRDGRILEIDGWSVPGGRLVSVAERTEQERLSHLRRQLESTAVRQLRAPIDEITARGRELYQQVPASAASKLRAIFAATDRLDRVVRMMLRGTPHDPALRPPRKETFGVAGLLWGLLHDWDSALRQRALRVELDIAPDLPDVRTDPALVEEILTELVDNSAKYTPRGGTVALSARRGEASVVIEVKDTGSGFQHEDLPHATERFFRGQYAESIPGAGLGLGVAAALAERLNGTLTIQPGPGGHVVLELPARMATIGGAGDITTPAEVASPA